MTNRVKERNLLILQMRQAGVPVREIAEKFKISKTLVGKAIQRFRDKELFRQKRTALIEQIRQANDLDKKWNAAELIEALQLLKVTQTGLTFHLEDIVEISLRELMDLTIKGVDEKGHLIVPLLSVRCVGKYGFHSMVNRLTEIDFGSAFNGEWKTRLEMMERCWRMKGPQRYSWSQPLTS